MVEVKKTVKKISKVEEKKEIVSKKQKELVNDVIDMTGNIVEKITLPESLFGAKINDVLMAQAVRVYLANQRQGTSSTKTRGEVDGSTRKIYRQKGTGRARHGGIRAPIFVKGGIAHGPKPRDYSLTLPTQMKRAAIKSALTTKLHAGDIKIVAGFEKIEIKTKIMAQALKKIGLTKNLLFVMPNDMENVFKAARNMKGVTVTAANRVNTYELLQAKTIILMKDAIATLEKTFVKEK